MKEESNELPVWARPEAFASAGEGWGWVDRKGNRFPCESLDGLAEAIIDDAGARMDLVWTPAAEFLVLPEEIPELRPALGKARIRWAEWEIGEGKRQMLVFGAFLGISLVIRLLRSGHLAIDLASGMAFLLFLWLGFVPWYQGRKRLQRGQETGADLHDLEGLRFETWLTIQKAPVTRLMLLLIAAVGIVQWLSPGAKESSILAAGLIKVDGRALDWWRLFTAPFLHGNPLHLLFNAAALAYLGKRVELFVRWPHLAGVFILSAWIGSEASARFVDGVSVGASGGLMGLLGFLLVFESMHPRLVPASSRRRLLAGLILTAMIGVVGFKFIDNAAHAGGLIAGMLYAFAVFPKSSSTRRPKEAMGDQVVGGAAVGVILASAAWACLKILGV